MAVLLKERSQQAERTYLNKEEVLRKAKRYWLLRRTQDVLLSGLALLALWPVIAVFALIIWIDSPGASPIFAQDRVGRNGKVFRFYKLRSMIPNAEAKLEALLDQNEMEGPVFKIKDDPRITRVGKILRELSLDELMQFFNVLKGDMSLVGPRPEIPFYVRQFREDVPLYLLRQQVRHS